MVVVHGRPFTFYTLLRPPCLHLGCPLAVCVNRGVIGLDWLYRNRVTFRSYRTHVFIYMVKRTRGERYQGSVVGRGVLYFPRMFNLKNPFFFCLFFSRSDFSLSNKVIRSLAAVIILRYHRAAQAMDRKECQKKVQRWTVSVRSGQKKVTPDTSTVEWKDYTSPAVESIPRCVELLRLISPVFFGYFFMAMLKRSTN